jgi:hypothetical protein
MHVHILDQIMAFSSKWQGFITLRRKETQAPLLVLKARLPLGQHHQLFLVESCGRELIIATAPQGVQLLAIEPRKERQE